MRKHPLSEIARRCAEQGVRSPTVKEERQLAFLFRKEVRKAAFRPETGPPDAVLRSFCAHVEQNFATHDGVVHVIDYRRMLRSRARAAARAKVPVTALVLFSTWIEHWLSMTISVGMLSRGDDQTAIESYFARQPTLEDKLAVVEHNLSLGSLPRRDELIRLITARNRFVHYVWKGQPAGVLHREVSNMRAIARNADRLLEALLAFEHACFDAPYAKLSATIFPRAG